VFAPDVANYGPVFAQLLDVGRINELGPGTPHVAARGKLKELTAKKAFAGRHVVDGEMASACIAGVWLLHDFPEESHRISQAIDTPTGSYWHGIMHRREPDYSNARYWFRRVGTHPVFRALAESARQLAAEEQADGAALFLADRSDWDPLRFVDLCEMVAGGNSSSERLCRRVQHQEWWLLFDWCWRQAIGQVA